MLPFPKHLAPSSAAVALGIGVNSGDLEKHASILKSLLGVGGGSSIWNMGGKLKGLAERTRPAWNDPMFQRAINTTREVAPAVAAKAAPAAKAVMGPGGGLVNRYQNFENAFSRLQKQRLAIQGRWAGSKSASRIGLGMFAKQAAFASWARAAVPYAAKWWKAAPSRVGRGIQTGAGKAMSFFGRNNPTGAAATTGERWSTVGSAANTATKANLAAARAPAESAFGALPNWQQKGMRGGLYAGKTLAGMNVPGLMAHSMIGYPLAARAGARQVTDQVANQFDALSQAGFADRGRLALALAFKPQMLSDLSSHIRTLV